jgi:transglutaminase-like putative cysteine protease
MQARAVLEKLGVQLSRRQIKRAAEMDATGRRKLPFFIDPIDKKLKIERGTLVRIYQELQVEAENNLRK